MGLRIVSEELQSGAEPNVPPDGYVERLRKYIPTEVVTFWLVVSSAIQSTADDVPKAGLLWICFIIGLAFTFAWTKRETKVPEKPTAWTQILLSCGAFVVWVIPTGSPFALLPFYKPVYGFVLLATYTMLIAFVIPPEK